MISAKLEDDFPNIILFGGLLAGGFITGLLFAIFSQVRGECPKFFAKIGYAITLLPALLFLLLVLVAIVLQVIRVT